jgi:hypothetical protein
MGIFQTQAIHNAVTAVLRMHPLAQLKHYAFVEISTFGVETKAALMTRPHESDEWQIETIYTADHYIPGDVGVRIKGLW